MNRLMLVLWPISMMREKVLDEFPEIEEISLKEDQEDGTITFIILMKNGESINKERPFSEYFGSEKACYIFLKKVMLEYRYELLVRGGS